MGQKSSFILSYKLFADLFTLLHLDDIEHGTMAVGLLLLFAQLAQILLLLFFNLRGLLPLLLLAGRLLKVTVI